MRALMTMNATDVSRITMTGHDVPEGRAADYFSAVYDGAPQIKQEALGLGEVRLVVYTDPVDGTSRYAVAWSRDRVWQISDTSEPGRGEDQFFLVAAREAKAAAEAGVPVQLFDWRPKPVKKRAKRRP